MPYLIDGHNLIPKIPGLSLKSVDDETHLIQLLQEFCRFSRKQVEVYFDNAPAGHANRRRYGQVTAIFVRQGIPADDAIRQRLNNLGASAKNWILVSSDGQVQAAGRAAHARVMTSDQFSAELLETLRESPPETDPRNEVLTKSEVDEWLAIFDSGPKSKSKPKSPKTKS